MVLASASFNQRLLLRAIIGNCCLTSRFATQHRRWDQMTYSGGIARHRRIRSRTVADECYGGDAPSARVLVGLDHGGDEVDEQPQRERRLKKDCQGDQAAIVGQKAAVERRLLPDPVHWETPF